MDYDADETHCPWQTSLCRPEESCCVPARRSPMNGAKDRCVRPLFSPYLAWTMDIWVGRHSSSLARVVPSCSTWIVGGWTSFDGAINTTNRCCEEIPGGDLHADFDRGYDTRSDPFERICGDGCRVTFGDFGGFDADASGCPCVSLWLLPVPDRWGLEPVPRLIDFRPWTWSLSSLDGIYIWSRWWKDFSNRLSGVPSGDSTVSSWFRRWMLV